MVHGDQTMSDFNYNEYMKNVMADVQELKEYYPFTTYSIAPSQTPTPVEIKVVAANRELIECTCAEESDFLGEYSRQLNVVVPFDYKNSGCNVYGAKWVNLKKIPIEDQHFFSVETDGRKLLCVGVPESFPSMRNVILENVKTAESMLTAYERYQKSNDSELMLKAYSHGVKGWIEYDREKKRL